MSRLDTKALSTEIRSSKAQRARQMSLDESLTAGAKLYAEQRQLTRSLVSGLHPNWTYAKVDGEMFRREDLIRQRNTKKFYRPVISMDDQPVKSS